jgi:hypothetical protein
VRRPRRGRTGRPGRTLRWFLVLYAAASLLHFAHNAAYLAEYPNLPGSWTRADVYVAWCGITALGLLGYGLYIRGHPGCGLTLLASYAALGFDGLLHYTRAPLSHHSAMMNLTIWTEVAGAALLLGNVVSAFVRHSRPISQLHR